MTTRENKQDVAFTKQRRAYTPILSEEDLNLLDRYCTAKKRELGLGVLSRGNALWMAARGVMVEAVGEGQP